MVEYKFQNATVRIHPGKRTEEERRIAIEAAAIKLLKQVHKKKKAKAGETLNGRC